MAALRTLQVRGTQCALLTMPQNPFILFTEPAVVPAGGLQKLLNRPDSLQVFQKFDTDHSGTVDRDELRMGVRLEHLHITDKAMHD